MEFNFADIFEAITDAVPDNVALASGGRRYTFGELDEKANRLAHFLSDRGIGAGDHIGLHLWNGVEFVVAMIAAVKLRAVPININYRFVAAEVRYMIDNADLRGVVSQRCYSAVLDEATEGRAPLDVIVLADDDSGATTKQPATSFEDALAAGAPERGFPPRSGDDLYIIYTVGTTGFPKGVMWRQKDLLFAGLQGGAPGGDPVETPEEIAENAKQGDLRVTMLPCPPFIHGAAQFTAWICWWTGGKLVLLADKSFDAERVLDLIASEEVTTLMVVGDAMAQPILEQLRRTDRDFDVESLAVIASSGAILSPSIKAGLEEKLDSVMILNNFGTTEAGHAGTALEDADGRPSFYMDESCTVFDPETWEPIEPGSGAIGLLARTGPLPLGYYKDEEKTAERFKEIGGKRWVVPGDFATIEDDGRITFKGRGSKCINTGGEKVFPEEVEEVLKGHPQIIDALVVGVPDPRWMQRIAAVVSTRGGVALSLEEVQAHCRKHIAGYKVPRQLSVEPTVERMPSGKPDYRWAEQVALDAAKREAQA